MTTDIKPTEVAISHTFNDSDWRSITVFKKRTQELSKVRIFNGGRSKISARLDLNRETGLTIKTELPDEDQLKELYMAFRFFYLEKEASHFNKVANIIKRAAKNEFVDGFVEHLKKQWSGALLREKVFGIRLNNNEINAKYLLDLWFNAYYFHSDEEKEKDLVLLNSLLSVGFSRFLLANSVYEASKAVFRLYESLAQLENIESTKKLTKC